MRRLTFYPYGVRSSVGDLDREYDLHMVIGPKRYRLEVDGKLVASMDFPHTGLNDWLQWNQRQGQ